MCVGQGEVPEHYVLGREGVYRVLIAELTQVLVFLPHLQQWLLLLLLSLLPYATLCRWVDRWEASAMWLLPQNVGLQLQLLAPFH